MAKNILSSLLPAFSDCLSQGSTHMWEKSYSDHFHFVPSIVLESFGLITPVCWRRWAETAAVLCDCSFVLSETQTSPDISLTQHTLTSLCAERGLSLTSFRDEPRVRNLLSCSRLCLRNQAHTITVYCFKHRPNVVNVIKGQWRKMGLLVYLVSRVFFCTVLLMLVLILAQLS